MYLQLERAPKVACIDNDKAQTINASDASRYNVRFTEVQVMAFKHDFKIRRCRMSGYQGCYGDHQGKG